MHVEHFMTRNPVACDITASIREVGKLMADKGVGSVVVLQGGKVAGIVTDRQLAVRGLAEDLDGEAPVSEVMTVNPACVTLDDNLFSAIDTMRSAGVARRVPVVNAEKELLGVVSIADIGVIAKDLLDYILLENTHHAMNEAHILTGAKRLVDVIRRPTKEERVARDQEIRPVTVATPLGGGAHGGTTYPTSEQRGLARRDEAEMPGTRAERSARAQDQSRQQGNWFDRLMGRT